MHGKFTNYVTNGCFENVAKFRYTGTTVRRHSVIGEEIKGSLKVCKAGYHSK
jgi:hypothetical protein